MDIKSIFRIFNIVKVENLEPWEEKLNYSISVPSVIRDLPVWLGCLKWYSSFSGEKKMTVFYYSFNAKCTKCNARNVIYNVKLKYFSHRWKQLVSLFVWFLPKSYKKFLYKYMQISGIRLTMMYIFINHNFVQHVKREFVMLDLKEKQAYNKADQNELKY